MSTYTISGIVDYHKNTIGDKQNEKDYLYYFKKSLYIFKILGNYFEKIVYDT